MNSNYFVYVLCLLCICNACNKKDGIVYLTGDTHSGVDIQTVKILKHTDNQNKKENLINDHKSTTFYNGCDWYSFEVPEGLWDVYIEYFENNEFKNIREEIVIKTLDNSAGWAAVWLIDSSAYSSRKEFGNGQFELTNSVFKE